MASPHVKTRDMDLPSTRSPAASRVSEDGEALSQRRKGTDALLPLPAAGGRDRRQETAADVHVAGEARTEGPMDALVLEQQRQLQIVKAKTMFEVRWSSLSVCPAAGDFWT